jgi:pimeloyl-ACP methyl ester carboxylesterase
MPDLSAYPIVLFVHVLSAVILVGHSVGAPLILRYIRTAPSANALRTSLEFAHNASKWNPLTAVVLLGTGIYLGSIGWWTQPWFYVAAGAWIANSVLAKAVVERATVAMSRAAARAVDDRVPADADRLRQAAGWRLAVAGMIGNDLAILYVMFSKPELAASLAVVALFNILTLVTSLLRSRTGATDTADCRLQTAD